MGRDGIVGLFLLAITLWLYHHTGEIPHPPFIPLGPEFYPRGLLGLLGGLSVALVATDVLSRGSDPTSRRGKKEESFRRRIEPYGQVLLTYFLFGGYVALMPLVGFRVATLLFVAALAWMLGPRSVRHGVVSVSLAAAFTAAVYFVFEVYLKLLLPRGVITGV
jgi:putative tricarboxylic transport membrane protein